MKEIRVKFHINNKRYILFIEKGILKIKGLYLMEDTKRMTTPIPIEVSTSTPKEKKEYWLYRLKRYLAKKRRNKCS